MADDKNDKNNGLRFSKERSQGHAYAYDELEDTMDGLADQFRDGMLSEEEFRLFGISSNVAFN